MFAVANEGFVPLSAGHGLPLQQSLCPKLSTGKRPALLICERSVGDLTTTTLDRSRPSRRLPGTTPKSQSRSEPAMVEGSHLGLDHTTPAPRGEASNSAAARAATAALPGGKAAASKGMAPRPARAHRPTERPECLRGRHQAPHPVRAGRSRPAVCVLSPAPSGQHC